MMPCLWWAPSTKRWSWGGYAITPSTSRHLCLEPTAASQKGELLQSVLVILLTYIFTHWERPEVSHSLPQKTQLNSVHTVSCPSVPCSRGPTCWWWWRSWSAQSRRPWTWCPSSPTWSWRNTTSSSGWWSSWTLGWFPSTPGERSRGCTCEIPSWQTS